MKFSTSQFVRAFHRLAALLLISGTSLAQWVQLGPPGAISCVLNTGQVLMAGVPGTGLYVSSDNGGTWFRARTGLTSLNVTALAALDGDVYAATSGGGVFQSTDNGKNWTDINRYLISKDIGTLSAFNGKLYAGPVGFGVFYSIDSGYTWLPTLKGLATGTVNLYCSMDSTLFAGTTAHGVYRSSDQGETWSSVNSGLPPGAYVSGLTTIGTTLFAGVFLQGVYSSNDHGLSWISVSNGLANRSVTCLVAVPNPSGGGTTLLAGTGTGGIFASPDSGAHWSRLNLGQTSNTVGALSVYGSTVYAGLGEGVRVSTDGGLTWGGVGIGLSGSVVTGIALAPDRLYVGTNSNGIYASSDKGSTWIRDNAGLSDFEISAMNLDGPASTLYVGAGDGNIFHRSPSDSAFTVGGGRPGLPPSSINALTASGGYLVAGPGSMGVYISSDFGANWVDGRGSYQAPLGTIISSFASSPSFLFAGAYGAAGLYRSSDNGRSWTGVSPGPPDKHVHAIFILDTLIFAGTDAGVYSYVYQGDAPWQSRSDGLGALAVSSFAAAGTTILAGTYSAGVFVSTDRGAHWNPASDGLPVNDVRILATDGVDIYAGTSLGGVCRRSIGELLTTTGIAGTPALPEEFHLSQNYPNPFNPTTALQFTIHDRQSAIIKVFDMLGRDVATLVNEVKAPGTYTVQFDARGLASGVYFCRLQAGSFVETRRLVLLR